MSEALLAFGAPAASPTLRHEVPLAIVDPFLWAHVDGRTAAVVNVLEIDRVRPVLPDLEVLSPEELGVDELVAAGVGFHEVDVELNTRAVARLGLRSAVVPGDFPLALADRLRADGVELRPDDALFEERRRVKTEHELEGIRRAQRAAEAGFATAAALVREAGDGTLTAEDVRAAIRETCATHGALVPAGVIVAPGAQGAAGHDPGHGPLPALADHHRPRPRRTRRRAAGPT